MTLVLVVDDSAVDRRMIGGLLGRDADLEVQFAENGRQALQRFEAAPPEMVVTDLLMPEMDGLELVEALRRRHPLVPVILVTSKGSEDIAMRALQAGAASFVPKRVMGRDLLDTVHRVLAVSCLPRSHTRLIGRMQTSHCRFVLENEPALFRPLVTYLQESIAYMGLYDDAERTRVGVALEEALANALYHGNLGIGPRSALEDADYYGQIHARAQEPPYRARRIHVEAVFASDHARFTIRDEGLGFDPATLPDPTLPENLEKTSGRGVFLMRTFMDEVRYNAAGNEVTLVKRCRRGN